MSVSVNQIKNKTHGQAQRAHPGGEWWGAAGRGEVEARDRLREGEGGARSGSKETDSASYRGREMGEEWEMREWGEETLSCVFIHGRIYRASSRPCPFFQGGCKVQIG
jgi:hypothetical protein